MRGERYFGLCRNWNVSDIFIHPVVSFFARVNLTRYQSGFSSVT